MTELFVPTKHKIVLTHRQFATFALLLMATMSGAHPGRGAEWQPPVEPGSWQETRENLQTKGVITKKPWIFFGALETDTTLAAEYLSNLRSSDSTTTFDGLLLIKRSQAGEGTSTDWTARPLTMRAICQEGRLERQGADGVWSPYPGRADTAAKVSWICQQTR